MPMNSEWLPTMETYACLPPTRSLLTGFPSSQSIAHEAKVFPTYSIILILPPCGLFLSASWLIAIAVVILSILILALVNYYPWLIFESYSQNRACSMCFLKCHDSWADRKIGSNKRGQVQKRKIHRAEKCICMAQWLHLPIRLEESTKSPAVIETKAGALQVRMRSLVRVEKGRVGERRRLLWAKLSAAGGRRQ